MLRKKVVQKFWRRSSLISHFLVKILAHHCATPFSRLAKILVITTFNFKLIEKVGRIFGGEHSTVHFLDLLQTGQLFWDLLHFISFISSGNEPTILLTLYLTDIPWSRTMCFWKKWIFLFSFNSSCTQKKDRKDSKGRK